MATWDTTPVDWDATPVDWDAVLDVGVVALVPVTVTMSTVALTVSVGSAVAQSINLAPITLTITPVVTTISLTAPASFLDIIVDAANDVLTDAGGDPLAGLIPGGAGPAQSINLVPTIMTILQSPMTIVVPPLAPTEEGPPGNFGLPTIYTNPRPPEFLENIIFGPIVTRRRRVDIYLSDGETLWMADAPLISGSVNVDMDRDTRRMVDLVLDNDDRHLDHFPDGFWYDNVLKVYHGVETPDAIWETQIGEFMIDSIREPHFPHQVSVKGRDYAKKLMQDEFPAATAFSKGQPVGNVIKIIATNGGITKMNVFDDGEILGADITFERKTSRWEAINKIADAHSLEVFFDRFGYMVLRRYRDPQASPLAFSFLTGLTGNLSTYDKESNDANLKNHVVVTGAATANNIPVFAEAENTNPSSASSSYRIGRRTLPEDSAFITTVAQAKQRADVLLAVASLESYTVDLGAIVAPWLEEGNAVEFLDPRPAVGQPTRYLLTSFDIPLELGTMNAHGKRLTIVTSTGAERKPPGYGTTYPPTTTPPTPGESVAPVVTQQPVNTAAVSGTQFSLSASATGAPVPAVQWQMSTTGSAGPFANISGATNVVYTAVASPAISGNYYRSTFTNAYGVVNSNPVQVTVTTATPAGNPGKARLAWFYFDSANPPSDATITAWAPQLALAVLHPKLTATRAKIKAANPNCRVLAAKSIWSVAQAETSAPFSTAISYAQAQQNSWLAQTGTPSAPSYGTLVFEDLFPGSAIDTTKWNTQYSWGLFSTASTPLPEGYNDPAQVTVSGGTLKITATKTPITGVNPVAGGTTTYPWRCGVVSGHGKFAFQYGTVEWRARWNGAPANSRGMWPALWLLGVSGANEIDALELLGDNIERGYVNVHYGSVDNQAGPFYIGATPLPAQQFNTYRLEWKATGIKFYFNDVLVQTVANTIQQQMYLIMNLSVGGPWPQPTNASTQSGVSWEIDYVRVWQ